jgi:hypothetical protein
MDFAITNGQSKVKFGVVDEATNPFKSKNPTDS